MNLLKSTILKTAALAGLATSAFTGVALAADDSLIVHVPFAFEVKGHELPAGRYVVSDPGPNGVVYLRGPQTSVMALSVPADGSANDHAGLVFALKDGKRTLVGVQTDVTDVRLIPSRAESR